MNTNINNETKKEVVAPENATKKVIKLNTYNLDNEQLVLRDEKLAEISIKPFDEMDEDEMLKLHLCKAKVVEVERVDKFTGKKTTNYKAIVLLCDGIKLEKYLDENDILSIKNFNPDLITNGQAQIYVPVKLTTFIAKDGKSRKFNYTICLSNNVYMGTTRKESNGYLDKKIVENIIAFNLANKSRKDRLVKFVEVNADLFTSKRKDIEENEDSVDNF